MNSGPDEKKEPDQYKLRISVALCTYNGELYLKEQLESILKQSRIPDEVVICDDGSADRTVEMIRDFAQAATFPVRIFVNTTRLGSTKNFEQAIRLCEGDVIVLCDQDDCWYETRLSLSERAFLNNQSIGLAFTDADLIDEDSRLLGVRYWETCGLSESRIKKMQNGMALDVLLRHNVILGSMMAFRANLRDILLPIPEMTWHDLWIALIVSVISEIEIIPVSSIRYRKHSAQQAGVLYYHFRESVAKAMQIRAAEYLSLASQYAMARDRIREYRPGPQSEQKLGLIERKISHMKMRAALPAKRWRRLPMIFRDMVNLNYFRYAEGYKSIAKDLVR